MEYLLFLTAVLLPASFAASNPDILFKNVDRTIDISSQMAKITYKVILENTGSKNVDQFDFVLEPETAKAVSYFGAEGGELLKSTLTAVKIETPGK